MVLRRIESFRCFLPRTTFPRGLRGPTPPSPPAKRHFLLTVGWSCRFAGSVKEAWLSLFSSVFSGFYLRLEYKVVKVVRAQVPVKAGSAGALRSWQRLEQGGVTLCDCMCETSAMEFGVWGFPGDRPCPVTSEVVRICDLLCDHGRVLYSRGCLILTLHVFVLSGLLEVTVLLDFMTRDRERKVVWPIRLDSKQTWPY